MSGQWEKYVGDAAKAIRDTPWKRNTWWVDEDGNPVEESDPRAVQLESSSSEDHEAEARAVLAIVGPLIAEDTRTRMVEAAARILKRSIA